MVIQKVSRRQKLDSLNLLAQGYQRKEVALTLHISESTIGRAKRRQRVHGDIEGGKKKVGRRAKFTPETINVHSHILVIEMLIEQVLLSMIMKVPDAHLSEYLKEIEQRCGVTVSKGRLSDILSEYAITRKKVKCLPLNANHSSQKKQHSVMLAT